MTANERLALIQDLQRKYPPGSLEEIRRLLHDPQRSAAVEKSASRLRSIALTEAERWAQ